MAISADGLAALATIVDIKVNSMCEEYYLVQQKTYEIKCCNVI